MTLVFFSFRECELRRVIAFTFLSAICLDRNDQNRAMIIMEFIKEGSLDRYLHTQRDFIRFPGQLFLYARDIVEGMDYLQSQGIIHR